jgi:hypothetical protein
MFSKKINLLLASTVLVISGLTATVAQASQDNFLLPLGDSSTPTTVLPFYCYVANATSTDQVQMMNRAVLVTGFTNGMLSISAYQLNDVYFNTYHNPGSKYNGQYGYVLGGLMTQNPKAVITCQIGQGSGRTLMAGSYGLPKS